MGKITNLTQMECDRCGAKEVLTQGAPNTSYWHDVQRTSSDGVTVERLLCDDCYKSYAQLVSNQDAEFEAFMEEGSWS